jgi:hypothetical protein
MITPDHCVVWPVTVCGQPLVAGYMFTRGQQLGQAIL